MKQSIERLPNIISGTVAAGRQDVDNGYSVAQPLTASCGTPSQTHLPSKSLTGSWHGHAGRRTRLAWCLAPWLSELRVLKRIWDGLTNVRAHPDWGPPVVRRRAGPVKVVAASPQDGETLIESWRHGRIEVEEANSIFSLASRKPLGPHCIDHHFKFARRRLIIRVAGIRPWCHFLRTHTPLETP